MSLAESSFNSDRSLLAALETKRSTFADAPLWKSPARSTHPDATTIVFIDAEVSDVATLMAGVQAGTEVQLLDPGNAIEQITQTLLGRKNISSIHIVSHGQAGGVLLGETWLGAENLDRYADQLRSWGTSLTESADIFLYGCDVAKGELGQSFVDNFSHLTGAEIAASDDLTGKGGDWALEVQTGAIEATSPFQTSTLAAYDDALNVTINEWSRGTSGRKEWVELLVIAPADMRGWTLADDTGTYTTFSSSPLWQSVAAGTLLVIYNGGDRDTTLASDDTNFSDGNFQIVTAHNNSTLFTPSSWSGFSNSDATDNPILRNSTGTIVHDWDQGNSTTFTTATKRPGAGQSVSYEGDSASAVVSSTIWARRLAGNATPGSGNGGTNTTWINSLRGNPVISLPSASTINYSENAAAIVLDPAATLTDADNPPNFNTGILTVRFSANGTTDDRLAIQNQGTSAGQIGISGSNVTFGGTTIGTFTGGTGTTNLVITFNTNATTTAVEALLRNLTYVNVSDAPSTLDRTVSFAMTDGAGGTSTTQTKTVSVTAVNDAPSFTAVNQKTKLGQQVIPLSLWTRGFNLEPEETDQAIDTFTFTNSNPGMFTEFRFESDGTLVFTPSNALATPTTATIAVRVRDNGGTANGGINESTIQTFTITVVPPPRIVIESVSRAEGNSGTTSFDFNVSLSHQSLDPVTVRYATEDISARVADRDYASTSGVLSFAPGELRKTITVRVIGDTKAESIEQFLVRLSSPTSGTILSRIGIGTIFTDDSGSWIGSSATATSLAPLLSSPTATSIAALRTSSPTTSPAPTMINLLRVPNLTLPEIATVSRSTSSLSASNTNPLQQNPDLVKKTVWIDDNSTAV